MKIIDTGSPEAKIVVPRRISDSRGFFAKVWKSMLMTADASRVSRARGSNSDPVFTEFAAAEVAA